MGLVVNQLEGVSEGDLMRRAEIGTEHHRSWWLSALSGKVSLAQEFVKSHGVIASEIMTKNVFTAKSNTPLWEIAETMEKKKIKRLPVLRGQRLIGIVSRSNLLQALTAQRDRITEDTSADDQSIRDELLQVLQKERWPNMAHLNVVVSAGTVHFWGLVNSEAQSEALRVAAENISGVKDVVDHTIIAGSS